jgi:hypothetical protein
MILQLLAFAFTGGKGTQEGADALATAWNNTLIVLLGVGIGIVGIVFIVGGSRSAQLAGSVAELVATKGASIAE